VYWKDWTRLWTCLLMHVQQFAFYAMSTTTTTVISAVSDVRCCCQWRCQNLPDERREEPLRTGSVRVVNDVESNMWRCHLILKVQPLQPIHNFPVLMLSLHGITISLHHLMSPTATTGLHNVDVINPWYSTSQIPGTLSCIETISFSIFGICISAWLIFVQLRYDE